MVALNIFIAFLSVVSVSALTRFELTKRNDREFVAGILARAAKGLKYVFIYYLYKFKEFEFIVYFLHF